MAQGISSNGTVFEFKEAGGSTWTTVAEVGDMQLPGTTKNEFDISSHNTKVDKWVLGIMRRELMTFPMFFNKAITSQVSFRALHLDNNPATNMTNGFRITSPDGEVLVFSGGVKDFKRTQPVDGVQTANCSIRATGNFSLDGVEYGS